MLETLIRPIADTRPEAIFLPTVLAAYLAYLFPDPVIYLMAGLFTVSSAAVHDIAELIEEEPDAMTRIEVDAGTLTTSALIMSLFIYSGGFLAVPAVSFYHAYHTGNLYLGAGAFAWLVFATKLLRPYKRFETNEPEKG